MGRSILDIERGHIRLGSCHLCVAADKFIGASLTQYLRAVGTREMNAIQSLGPPKQIAMFCGPELYQPDNGNMLTTLSQYQRIIDVLVPKDSTTTNQHLWRNDRYEDKLFVDPNNYGKIMGVIDWQSCHISPFFRPQSQSSLP